MVEHHGETLAFLRERGLDLTRTFSGEEKRLLGCVHAAFYNAGGLVVRLGGKAGRLGECIVATALLEGLLQALSYAGKSGTPVSIIVDEGVAELFDVSAYQDAYWAAIRILTAPTAELPGSDDLRDWAFQDGPALLVDLHGAHDEMPYLQALGDDLALMHLSRVGIRYYARHGPVRRYADFIEDLFSLKTHALDGALAQPIIRLGAADTARYSVLARTFDLHEEALHILCFFQSVVVAKCYERWDEVLHELSAMTAQRWPGKRLQFLVACGPEEQQADGFRQEDLVANFTSFTSTQNNALVKVERTPSLYDLAVLLSRASLVLSDDTGPGHLAGALGIPTVTPFLPGGVYSKEVWASSLWHRGITLEPNPFTTQQIESAVIWSDTSIINSIEPAHLAAEALTCLAKEDLA